MLASFQKTPPILSPGFCVRYSCGLGTSNCSEFYTRETSRAVSLPHLFGGSGEEHIHLVHHQVAQAQEHAAVGLQQSHQREGRRHQKLT